MRTALKSALAAAACTAVACSAAQVEQVEQVEQDRAAPAKEAKMKPSTPSGDVANLPFARGRTFGSLDEYLAHLEANAAIDLPYWREIRPGVYQWTVRMPEAGGAETASREELLRRYGFDR